MATAAGRTSSGAQNTQQAAQALAGMAAELQQLVSQFHYDAERDQVGPVPAGNPAGGNGENSGRKPGNRIPYRQF